MFVISNCKLHHSSRDSFFKDSEQYNLPRISFRNTSDLHDWHDTDGGVTTTPGYALELVSKQVKHYQKPTASYYFGGQVLLGIFNP